MPSPFPNIDFDKTNPETYYKVIVYNPENTDEKIEKLYTPEYMALRLKHLDQSLITEKISLSGLVGRVFDPRKKEKSDLEKAQLQQKLDDRYVDSELGVKFSAVNLDLSRINELGPNKTVPDELKVPETVKEILGLVWGEKKWYLPPVWFMQEIDDEDVRETVYYITTFLSGEVGEEEREVGEEEREVMVVPSKEACCDMYENYYIYFRDMLEKPAALAEDIQFEQFFKDQDYFVIPGCTQIPDRFANLKMIEDYVKFKTAHCQSTQVKKTQNIFKVSDDKVLPYTVLSPPPFEKITTHFEKLHVLKKNVYRDKKINENLWYDEQKDLHVYIDGYKKFTDEKRLEVLYTIIPFIALAAMQQPQNDRPMKEDKNYFANTDIMSYFNLREDLTKKWLIELCDSIMKSDNEHVPIIQQVFPSLPVSSSTESH